MAPPAGVQLIHVYNIVSAAVSLKFITTKLILSLSGGVNKTICKGYQIRLQDGFHIDLLLITFFKIRGNIKQKLILQQTFLHRNNVCGLITTL